MADAGCVGDILEIHMGDENDAGRFERTGEKETEGRTAKSREGRGVR